MPKRIRLPLLLAFSVPVALLGTFALLRLLFTAWFDNSSTTIETPRPLSFEEAKHCPIPLPKSARNIRYAEYDDWQVLDRYVRFEASPQDCIAEAEAILSDAEKAGSRVPEADRQFRAATTVPAPSAQYFKDLSWFDVGRMSQSPECLEIGGDNDLEPHIWINQKHGVFYYHLWH
ncbi:MAG TPA: hypothetical protein VIM48_11405 [Chthoniobacterales bacterium]